MSQTAYQINQDNAVAGLIGDMNPRTVDTKDNPTDVILFGHGVARVSADEGAIQKPALVGDVIVGVAVFTQNESGDYEALSAVPVLTQGRIYVPVEEAVTEGDGVFVRYAAVKQVQTFVLDADLVTSNVITVDVNGTTINHTFATTHDASMTAFAVKIQAHPDVLTAASATRTITITADSPDLDVTLTNEGITGGASQAGIVITETVASIPNSDRGKFRTDTGGTTAAEITRAQWVRGAAAGELALLNLNQL